MKNEKDVPTKRVNNAEPTFHFSFFIFNFTQ